MLGPDDAVYGLAGRIPDGAAGEGLLVGLGLTLVALGHSLHSFTTGKVLYSSNSTHCCGSGTRCLFDP
jgi:hypothetical protein